MTRDLLSILAMLAVAGSVAADEIRITPVAIENLGIRLASPERTTDVAATQGTAKVVVPPAGEAVVGAPQAGLLTGLTVAAGDEVVKGQLLAELRSPEFLSLQRDFLDALNTHRLAQSELRRDRQLHEEGIVSARRLEETTTQSRIAEASLNEHRQLLRIAGIDDTEIGALETRQTLLPSLKIRAPFDGVIIARLATTGQRVDAMSPIYRLADLSELWLEIAVPQERLAAVAPGMRVTDFSNTFAGEVTAIGRSIDASTQTVTVRARIVNGTETLSPGKIVGIEIVRESEGLADAKVWTVPATSVTRSGGASYVFVRTRSGFDVRTVDIVGTGENHVHVVADFSPDDLVAVSGISALKALWSDGKEMAPS
jgi:cobalt-zinc-cadmium efflux system membrane fusion protein